VVASAVGGLQYSVTDGVSGFLVPPHAPQALAQRLSQLHANPRLAMAMGRAGIHRVRSMFTWERVADLLLQAYGDVLATRPQTAVARRARQLKQVEQVKQLPQPAAGDALAIN
jgi:glycosyltransferase involved in cell wall biosynthesis